ncbi:MAG: ribonuclease HI [Magnetococcus sp. WYHC-3]
MVHDTRSGRVVEIFSDGACSGNPGPGGWGALLRWGEHEKQLMGYAPLTTNNRMELLAVIHALEGLKRPCQVIVTTDSSYVKDGMTRWIGGWRARGWKKKDGEPVANTDLWRRLDAICQRHGVQWRWVRGHDGHPENEQADRLAREAIKAGREGTLAVDPAGAAPHVAQAEDAVGVVASGVQD